MQSIHRLDIKCLSVGHYSKCSRSNLRWTVPGHAQPRFKHIVDYPGPDPWWNVTSQTHGGLPDACSFWITHSHIPGAKHVYACLCVDWPVELVLGVDSGKRLAPSDGPGKDSARRPHRQGHGRHWSGGAPCGHEAIGKTGLMQVDWSINEWKQIFFIFFIYER